MFQYILIEQFSEYKIISSFLFEDSYIPPLEYELTYMNNIKLNDIICPVPLSFRHTFPQSYKSYTKPKLTKRNDFFIKYKQYHQ